MTPHSLLAKIKERGHTIRGIAATEGCTPQNLFLVLYGKRGYSKERPRGSREWQSVLARYADVDVTEAFPN